MQKLIALVLVMVCVLAFGGCNADKGNTPNEDATNNNTYIVMEVTENNLVVAEIGENGKAIESKQYSVPNWFYPSTEIKVGSEISITHNGSILETFPMQFGEIYKMEYYDKEVGLLTTVIPE